MPEAQRQAAYGPINDWFGKYSGKITGGQELQPERTTTTVRFNNGKAVVTDGPFIEGKETIGGYAEVTVADLDEAIAMAKERPTGSDAGLAIGRSSPSSKETVCALTPRKAMIGSG